MITFPCWYSGSFVLVKGASVPQVFPGGFIFMPSNSFSEGPVKRSYRCLWEQSVLRAKPEMMASHGDNPTNPDPEWPCHRLPRLLRSSSLVTGGCQRMYGVVLFTDSVTDWPVYIGGIVLNLVLIYMHHVVTWPMGISAVFKCNWQSPCTALTAGNLPAVKAVQGDC